MKFHAALVAFLTPTPTATLIFHRLLYLSLGFSLGLGLWVRNWLLILKRNWLASFAQSCNPLLPEPFLLPGLNSCMA